MYSSAPNRLCPRHEARMLPTANSEQQSTRRSRVYAMSVLRLLSACYYNVVSHVTRRGKHPKQKIGEKQKFDPQRHCKSLTSGVEKACRQKRRLYPKLSCCRSTSSVVWPRYREGDAGIIDAGLEDSFSSFKETSHCWVKPQMREGMEGRLMSEPMGG